jgi:hypothetical protein
MAEQVHVVPGPLGNGRDVLELALELVGPRVAALPTASAIHVEYLEAGLESGEDRRPPRVIGGRPVNQHERSALTTPPDGDRRPVCRADELRLSIARGCHRGRA